MFRGLAVGVLSATLAGAAGPPRVLPFDWYANCLWFSGTVNGRGPFRLLLDTAAAGSVLNSARIPETGLTVLDEHSQVSAGSGDLPTRISSLPPTTIAFGGIALRAERFAALPLDQVGASYGRVVDAIVGRELMERYVVKIDFDARTLTLFEPEDFRYEGNGAVLPLEVRGGVPVVKSRFQVGGRAFEGEFLFDEPYPDTVMFATPFTRAHELESAMRKRSPRLLAARSTGVGGTIVASSGRLDWIEVGPYRLNEPIAALTEAKAGAFARNDIAGILGGELWRRFRVWFDYRRGRLILEPAAHYDDPFEFDASGLKVRGVGELEIFLVIAGTPASEAGVREGDRLISMDGRPAAELSAWEVRLLLRKPDVSHTLRLRRGDKEFPASIRTRRLL